jgi:hypothetical protein
VVRSSRSGALCRASRAVVVERRRAKSFPDRVLFVQSQRRRNSAHVIFLEIPIFRLIYFSHRLNFYMICKMYILYYDGLFPSQSLNYYLEDVWYRRSPDRIRFISLTVRGTFKEAAMDQWEGLFNQLRLILDSPTLHLS